MTDVVGYAIDLAKGKDKNQLADICRDAAITLYTWVYDQVGEEQAYNFMAMLFCTIAANDGKIKYIEQDLFNYVFNDQLDYDKFFEYCSIANKQSNRDTTLDLVSAIDKSVISACVTFMVCIAAIDGDFGDREIGIMYQFFNSWKDNH